MSDSSFDWSELESAAAEEAKEASALEEGSESEESEEEAGDI